MSTERNTENMLKWADALDSGDYEQGQGALTIMRPMYPGAEPRPLQKADVPEEILRDARFAHCCLGVACEEARKNGVELQVDYMWDDQGRLVRAYDGEWAYLPRKVIDWLGVPHSDPLLDLDGNRTAGQLNDEAGAGFSEISALVRDLVIPHEDGPGGDEQDEEQ